MLLCVGAVGARSNNGGQQELRSLRRHLQCEVAAQIAEHLVLLPRVLQRDYLAHTQRNLLCMRDLSLPRVSTQAPHKVLPRQPPAHAMRVDTNRPRQSCLRKLQFSVLSPSCAQLHSVNLLIS
jgi:hypothetical protein